MYKLLICVLFFTCSPQKLISQVPTANAGEVDPICHTPLKIRKEATRIVLIDCAGSETEIKLSEITGPSGGKGDTGAAGGPGRTGDPGQDSASEVIDWCRHSEVDHINRTIRIKITDITKQFGGYRSAADYPGKCGETENKCVCDDPVCQNQRPAVHHYLTDEPSWYSLEYSY